MEVKNSALIYEYVFRPAVLKYGLWNQLKIDHGQEFSLCVFVQDLLKNYSQGTEKETWKQTTSTQNNVIERLWPELNSRVNCPFNRALISIVEENDYNMSDPVLQYCVSWITNYICQDATQHLIKLWNHHRVPGPMGCIPVENMRLSQQNTRLNEVFVSSTSDAVRMYEELGGNLSRNSSFGWGPLVMNEEAYEHRLRFFVTNQPTGEAIFVDIVHGYSESLKISVEHL